MNEALPSLAMITSGRLAACISACRFTLVRSTWPPYCAAIFSNAFGMDTGTAMVPPPLAFRAMMANAAASSVPGISLAAAIHDEHAFAAHVQAHADRGIQHLADLAQLPQRGLELLGEDRHLGLVHGLVQRHHPAVELRQQGREHLPPSANSPDPPPATGLAARIASVFSAAKKASE